MEANKKQERINEVKNKIMIYQSMIIGCEGAIEDSKQWIESLEDEIEKYSIAIRCYETFLKALEKA